MTNDKMPEAAFIHPLRCSEDTRWTDLSPQRICSTSCLNQLFPRIDLTQDLILAKTDAKKIFETLPHSYERDSILGALGRVGTASLKHKARYRGQIVVDAFGDRPSELILVLDEAVNCRNHYVHGTPSKIDYSENSDVRVFLTNTLEFVFGASELVEAGWNIRRFAERGTTMTHPYGSYLVGYKRNLEDLKSLLNI